MWSANAHPTRYLPYLLHLISYFSHSPLMFIGAVLDNQEYSKVIKIFL